MFFCLNIDFKNNSDDTASYTQGKDHAESKPRLEKEIGDIFEWLNLNAKK